jgi:hypothetical protein
MGGKLTPEDGQKIMGLITSEKPVNVAQGGSLVDPRTGNVIYSSPAKPERPVSVAPGGTIVDPDTGKPLYTAPAKPERPVSVPEGGTLVDPRTGTVLHTSPKTPKEPTPTEQRTLSKSIADAEATILSNKSKEAASGQVDYFNQYAEKPYAYVWKKGSVYGGDWTKIKLPTIKGKQVTAAEVYYTAVQNGKTYDDILKSIGALK